MGDNDTNHDFELTNERKPLKAKLRDWAVKNGRTKYAEALLFFVSFTEASFFPIPPDFLLVAMVLVRPASWLRLATLTSIGSVFGALFGYAIGLLFFEIVGDVIIDTYSLHDEFATVGRWYSENGFLAVFIAGFTIIPFKIFTITAGVFEMNLISFLLASLVGRSLRFFIVSALMWRFKERIGGLLYRYFNILSVLVIALLVVIGIAVF